MEFSLRRGWFRYAAYFLVWTFLGFYFFTQGVAQKVLTRDPTPWWHYLISWLVGVYVWAVLVPLIVWLNRRFPIQRENWVRRVLLHVFFGVCVALLQLAIESSILPHLHVFPQFMNGVVPTFFFLMIIGFHQGILMYLTILGIIYGVRYYQNWRERERQAMELQVKTAELNAQLAQAQLSVLKSQLQPHFLFNTLNAIMVLVRQQKVVEAEETLSRFSDLLRCVLEDVEAQEVPLRRELECLRLYLSIEEMRFRDRLRVEWQIDPEVLDAEVPSMSLQPLVENAIRHGIGQRSASGRITISASRAGESLVLRIEDDGPGFSNSTSQKGTGLGLSNTRSRLQQLYGESASLSIAGAELSGARVTVTIPLRWSAEHETGDAAFVTTSGSK